MEVGDIVQIHIPENRKDTGFYKFNHCVGEIVEVLKCGNETGFAVISGTDDGLWPFEWLAPFEQLEEDESIETADLGELWKLK